MHHGVGANGQRIDDRAQGIYAEGLGQDTIELGVDRQPGVWHGDDLHAIAVSFPSTQAEPGVVPSAIGIVILSLGSQKTILPHPRLKRPCVA